MVRAIKSRKKIKRASNKASSSSAAAAKKSGPAPAKVWQPGVDKIEEDEELHCDPSAYNSLHAFHVGWPCLSFDIIRDSLGLVRSEFPHTAYLVAGTQANQSPLNSIEIFKLSNISGKKRNLVPPKKNEDGSDMEDDMIVMVKMKLRRVAHQGCVNRIRSMPQSPHICATWSDTGFVQVWDFSSHLNFLTESEVDSTRTPTSVINQPPLAAFKHKDEGYAIDWSPCASGRLVSGDCSNSIYLWEPTSGTKWDVNRKPFVGHSASVEDLQWSPIEENVFASCSVDMNIAIWDIRKGKSPAISFKAHDADVNVISWNRLASHLLASGSDDGTFKIHDLRELKTGDSVMAKFDYHKHPITSIEWSPHESATLAVTSADHQLTVWDLSLERDEEEEAAFKDETEDTVNPPENLPPQLLFVHQGQKDLKELHWHFQIPGMIVSTAGDGFNMLMPSNIDTPLPPANTAFWVSYFV
ncbi:hypothetical protein V2J09_012342 [Rumex salicifolius]